MVKQKIDKGNHLMNKELENAILERMACYSDLSKDDFVIMKTKSGYFYLGTKVEIEDTPPVGYPLVWGSNEKILTDTKEIFTALGSE